MPHTFSKFAPFTCVLLAFSMTMLVSCISFSTPTPTATPSPLPSPAPIPTATSFPVPTMRSVSSSTYCNSTTPVTFEGKERKFCLSHRLGSSEQLTSIGEIMSDSLLSENGDVLEQTAAVCDPAHNKCPAFIWYQKDKPENLHALPRLWPNSINKTLVAPILVWNKTGNPQSISNWQVLLIDRENGLELRRISNPWIQITDKDLIEFSPESGYFEVVKEVAGSLSPVGKTIGVQLKEPTPQMAIFEGIGFYEFPDEDAPKLGNILDWVKEAVPKWHQFILDQRPLKVYLNSNLPARGWGGAAICCSSSTLGALTGRIELGHRPRGDMIYDLVLASTLAHEATHVRDRRGGIRILTDRIKDCRTAERSAVESEQSFLTDVLNSPHADVTEKAVAGRLLSQVRDILSKGTFEWNPRCN